MCISATIQMSRGRPQRGWRERGSGIGCEAGPPPPPLPKALNLLNYYHNIAIYTRAFNLHKGNNSCAGGCGSHFITCLSLNYLFSINVIGLLSHHSAQLTQYSYIRSLYKWTLQENAYLTVITWRSTDSASTLGSI